MTATPTPDAARVEPNPSGSPSAALDSSGLIAVAGWAYSVAIGLSACLLFTLELMVGLLLLPLLGGAPSVWATTLGFFQLILLLGIVFASIDLGAGLGEALPLVVPIVVSTIVAAAFFSGVGLVIAAFVPRRAFSAGAIVATFLVLSGVVQVLVVQGRLRDPFRYVALLDPYALLDGLATTMFGGAGRNTTVTHSGLDPAIFAAGAVVVAVATLLVLVLRYRRIEA